MIHAVVLAAGASSRYGTSPPKQQKLLPAVLAALRASSVDDVLVVHDYGDEYGEPVGAMCAQAARERGLAVRIRPVWDQDEDPMADLGEARAVVYV